MVSVEAGEAEFCLEIIGLLFDHYFVTTNMNKLRLQRLIDKTLSAESSTDHSLPDMHV